MHNLMRFRKFVQSMTLVVEEQGHDEAGLFAAVHPLLSDLISHDDWLPDACAAPSTEGYRQYLLYCDAFERFSVVSFVWLPGQSTPVHDHTVWGLVGVLRGEELCQGFADPQPPQPLMAHAPHRIARGTIDWVSPRLGDLHAVSSARVDGPSVSIHVYGANIGAIRRHTFDPATGEAREFVSGYDNDALPNWWGSQARS
jgi:predicted metal-dependent enzyme (double-stranded beta helix superfamily)